jgi:hypothetical protein
MARTSISSRAAARNDFYDASMKNGLRAVFLSFLAFGEFSALSGRTASSLASLGKSAGAMTRHDKSAARHL